MLHVVDSVVQIKREDGNKGLGYVVYELSRLHSRGSAFSNMETIILPEGICLSSPSFVEESSSLSTKRIPTLDAMRKVGHCVRQI